MKNSLHVSIHHWTYYKRDNNDPPFATCWVYTSCNTEFEEWMSTNCPTATFCLKFNSGNPMYITYISDEKEILAFTLRWK